MKAGAVFGGGWMKIVVALVVVAAIAATLFWFRDALTLQRLSEHEKTLVAFRESHLAVVCLLGFLLYVAVTGLSLPGAAAMSLAYGWFFGFWRALLLISFASTAGATLAFLLSRYLLRETIQNRFGQRLQTFNDALEREGAFYLFTLRLIPAVPFFVINVVMGLTPIRVRTFWWVSQLGMLPGTCVYLYAGSQFPSLRELAEHGAGGILKPGLIAAFVLLGLFPLIVKRGMVWFVGRKDAKAQSNAKTPE